MKAMANKTIGRHLAAFTLAFSLATGAVMVPGHSAWASKVGTEETGSASYYANKFHGRKTASGEPYDKNAYTAAHRTLEFGTIICVENTGNGNRVALRVNDRGPFVKGRIVDVSHPGAKHLAMIDSGTAKVRVTVVDEGTELGNGCLSRGIQVAEDWR